jgi:hypothetical protein
MSFLYGVEFNLVFRVTLRWQLEVGHPASSPATATIQTHNKQEGRG